MFDFRLQIPERKSHVRSRCAPLTSKIANRKSNLPRTGITLIELLITITIIATLSATFLGVSRSAMEAASAARTKSTIAKIHGLLMERWASYETRRADIKPSINTLIENEFDPNERGRAMADVRLLAIRELMKLEMPDRWSDLTGTNSVSVATIYPHILNSYPALTQSYLRHYQRNPTPTIQNQGAECLYMIIMFATGDGEARSLFSSRDIGDTDEDGALEFLDGWGNAIEFVRWPTGFTIVSDLMSGDADTDPDPYDYYRRDRRLLDRSVNQYGGLRKLIAPLNDNNPAFRIVPLIFSSGPDGIFDIAINVNDIIDLDPFATTAQYRFGTPLEDNADDGWQDNIHNHLQDNR